MPPNIIHRIIAKILLEYIGVNTACGLDKCNRSVQYRLLAVGVSLSITPVSKIDLRTPNDTEHCKPFCIENPIILYYIFIAFKTDYIITGFCNFICN